jgi:hypothetical protein
MPSVYAAATQARLVLRTEAEVEAAIVGGLLRETHFLELKSEIPPNKGRSNTETARDLAQFAVDGGSLLVGVQEGAGGLARSPQTLAGLGERLESIAATLCDPPLPIICEPIPSLSDPAVGYLLVHVPPSPLAPHMVDGRYLARGDKSKRYLTDPEVLRLHQQRRISEADVLALLDVEIARDPFAQFPERQAHAFLVAEPLAGRPDMLLPLTDPIGSYHQRWLDFRQKSANPVTEPLLVAAGADRMPTDYHEWETFDRRPAAAAMSTHGIAQGRIVDPTGRETAGELEIGDSGSLRIYSSRLSRYLDTAQAQMFFEGLAVALTHRLVNLAAAASEEASYGGLWGLAIGVTGLEGSKSDALRQGSASSNPPRSEDGYRRATTSAWPELASQPGAVAERLIGQLLRGYRTRQRYAALLSAPPTAAP